MSTSISVTPTGAQAPISVSADSAKLFADALAEAKASVTEIETVLHGKASNELANIDATVAWLHSRVNALEAAAKADVKAGVQAAESAASSWLKAHEPFAVGVLLAALILAIRFHVL